MLGKDASVNTCIHAGGGIQEGGVSEGGTTVRAYHQAKEGARADELVGRKVRL